MNQRPPFFSPSLLRSEGTLGQAFDAWVRHYHECATCRLDDWYEPDAPHQALFCDEGRALFRRWDHMTMTSGRST